MRNRRLPAALAAILLPCYGFAQTSSVTTQPSAGIDDRPHSKVASQPAAGVQSAASQPVAPTTQPAMPSLIQELPDYSGDVWSRRYLTGDWVGARTELAGQGVLFDFGTTQILQGNAAGGKDTSDAFRYSGSLDFMLRLDTARMGAWPGGLITLRGETQLGQSINSKAGALLPVNYDALLPAPNESGLTTLSEYYITQALSEQVVVLAGKIDLGMGDGNVFAHDERTQFLNTAFRVNPVLFNAGPYTAMAAGVMLLPTDWLTITTFLNDNDPDGAATRSGFNTAFHGREWYSVSQEYTFTIKPLGHEGHQRFGWFWTSRDFLQLEFDSRLQSPVRSSGGFLRRRLVPGWLRAVRVADRIVSLARLERGTDDWGLYYNFDQYLFTECEDPKQGWGVFGRFGWSNGEANVLEQFYSLGLGGKGSIPNRDGDTWGIGYYCANTSEGVDTLLGTSSEQGVELFYNIELTPWLHLTPDLQIIIDPGANFRDRDVAIVYGIRAQFAF
jgi:porin